MAITALRTAYDDAVAARYDANYSDALSRAENGELAKILCGELADLSERMIYPSILDVGCGTGLGPDLIDEHEWFRDWWAPGYIGFDLSPAMLNVAQRKHEDLHFVLGDMEDLVLHFAGGGCFDLVVSTFALPYTEWPYHAIEQMFQMLTPGGRILLLTYSEAFRGNRHKRANHIVDGKVEFSTLTAEELDAYAQAAGFVNIAVTGFGYGTPWVGLERKLLGKRWPDLASYLLLSATRRHG